jgi:hypothetical protein
VLPKELTKVPRPNALPKNITLEELAQQNYVLAVQSALFGVQVALPRLRAEVPIQQKRRDHHAPRSEAWGRNISRRFCCGVSLGSARRFA